MSLLLVCLPLPDAPEASFSYVLSPDGQAVDRHGQTEAALLPWQDADEIVALVPVQALSWHRVDLPKGSTSQPARLRAVLEGLLEERVLDDMGDLHCALQPGAGKAGGPVWIAVCHANWLRQQLGALEAAGIQASRIVPEFAPAMLPAALVSAPPPASSSSALPADARVYAIGDDADREACWVRTGNDLETGDDPPGILRWPLPDPAQTDLQHLELPEPVRLLAAQASDAILADAAIAQRAEQALRQSVTVQLTAQRWLQAADTRWNLAQLGFANRQSDRVRKRASLLWQRFSQAPQWQPVRWGLAALLLVQLAGLNWAAFQERRTLAEQKKTIAAVLTDTFPQVRLVVDPPTQMQRELTVLRERSGALAAGELEGMLALTTHALPEAQLQALQWDGTQLRLKGMALSSAQQSSLQAAIHASGLTLTQDGNDWLIRKTP